MTSLTINNKDFVADEIGLQTSNAFIEFIRKIGCAPSRGRFQTVFPGFPLFSVSIRHPNLVGVSSNSPALSVSHFASNNTSL